MVCEKCQKKLGTVATPDTWKSGAKNTNEGGRKINENKALTGMKNRYNPYSSGKFKKCRICKLQVHQYGSNYCQVSTAIQSVLGQGCATTFNKLHDLEGTISYRRRTSAAKCSWTFPKVSNDNYVLVLDVKQINLFCSSKIYKGYLYFEDHTICQNTPFCRVYKTQRNTQCSSIDIDSHNISETCKSSAVVNVSSLPRELKFRALLDNYKSFTLDYKYIECPGTTVATTTSNSETESTDTQCLTGWNSARCRRTYSEPAIYPKGDYVQ